MSCKKSCDAQSICESVCIKDCNDAHLAFMCPPPCNQCCSPCAPQSCSLPFCDQVCQPASPYCNPCPPRQRFCAPPFPSPQCSTEQFTRIRIKRHRACLRVDWLACQMKKQIKVGWKQHKVSHLSELNSNEKNFFSRTKFTLRRSTSCVHFRHFLNKILRETRKWVTSLLLPPIWVMNPTWIFQKHKKMNNASACDNQSTGEPVGSKDCKNEHLASMCPPGCFQCCSPCFQPLCPDPCSDSWEHKGACCIPCPPRLQSFKPKVRRTEFTPMCYQTIYTNSYQTPPSCCPPTCLWNKNVKLTFFLSNPNTNAFASFIVCRHGN